MKKIFMMIICCICILGITGCGNKAKEEKATKAENSNKKIQEGVKASDFSIADFEWETNLSKSNGDDCYLLTFVNNSKYDILGIDFSYKVKGDVSEEDLKVYDAFISEHEDYIEEGDSPKNVTLRGSKNTLIKKNEKISDLRFTVGYENWSWYDYPTEEQFNLMEPKELQIGAIIDSKVYIAYYDFSNEKWSVDEKTVAFKTWPENELSKKISKPDSEYYIVTSDEEADDIDFTIYDTNKDYFKEYIEKAKEAGFTEDAPSEYDTYYSAKDKDGNGIDISYSKENKTISVHTNTN